MPHLDTAVRPAYRPYAVSVGAVRRLSPHFIRVTFVGDDLVHFGTAGLDQRIKVVLPLANLVGGYADFGQDEDAGDWYERWRGLPVMALIEIPQSCSSEFLRSRGQVSAGSCRS